MPLSFSLQNKPQPERNETKPESTERDNGDMNSALNDLLCGGCTLGGGLSDVSDDEHVAEIKGDDTPKSQKSNKHFRKSIPPRRKRESIEKEHPKNFF
jgi:hypothetical protein